MQGRQSAIVVGLALLVQACAGGGGTTPPPNQAPSFVSTGSISVAENVTAAYQAAATDPDGDALTFSITGGADAARFTITPAGALSFVVAPDFEAPADSGANNVYDVQLGVADGRGGTATLNLQVTVTNTTDGIVTTLINNVLDAPQFVLTRRLTPFRHFISRGGGRNVLRLDEGNPINVNSGGRDMEKMQPGQVLGIAQAPDSIYYVLSVDTNGDLYLRGYMDGAAWSRLDNYTLVIPHPGNTPPGNLGGWIGFGPDGYLYIATGDGGGTGDPGGNAQNKFSLWGKILRIQVTRPTPTTSAYAIPADNPFASGVGGAPEVWAYGFHDPRTGVFAGSDLIIGDMGETRREELNLIRAADKGGNYGWPFREGTLTYQGTSPAGLINPVLEYAHGTGPFQGQRITAGILYDGPIVSLRTLFVFGDWATGAIWTVPYAALTQGTTLSGTGFTRRNQDFAPNMGTIDKPYSFAKDPDGNMLIVDNDGQLYRTSN